MTRLLDTNILVHALNGVPSVRARLNDAAETGRILTSILVVAELIYGVERSVRREGNLRRVEAQLALIEVVPVSDGVARRFGRLKAELTARGIAKGDIDLLLAATALDLDAVLVTQDAALLDGSIPDLRAEAWLAASR